MSALNEECFICLEDLTTGIVVTQCGHGYHTGCLKRAVIQNPTCPCCRSKFRIEWLSQHELVNMKNLGLLLSSTPLPLRLESAGDSYWDQVENQLPEPPLIGPMLPSQQRWYNMEILEETNHRPLSWSGTWVSDRIAEMRVRFGIAYEVELSAYDVQICEINGILGVTPEWRLCSHSQRKGKE